jgi:hypothetical protein
MANSIAISGRVRSCTSQALMPPGLTTGSIVIACAEAVAARASPAAAASATRVRGKERFCGVAFSPENRKSTFPENAPARRIVDVIAFTSVSPPGASL